MFVCMKSDIHSGYGFIELLIALCVIEYICVFQCCKSAFYNNTRTCFGQSLFIHRSIDGDTQSNGVHASICVCMHVLAVLETSKYFVVDMCVFVCAKAVC